MTLLDSLGFVLNEIVFDAVGSTTSDWFAHTRVISTSWTDLIGGSSNYFSLNGDTYVDKCFKISELSLS